MTDSDEEPAAIRRMPPGEAENGWKTAHVLTNEPTSGTTRYNSAALARDLSGAHATDFDAFEFVRGLLGDVEELDGNASLMALDGVEHLLRKRRSIAARDEAFAREQLRQQLRSALRQRDDSMRITNISSVEEDVKSTSQSLRDAVADVESRVLEREKLTNARDIVRLLDGGELDVDRATEIIALLRLEDRKGTLSQILGAERYRKAAVLIDRAESQLSIRNSMTIDDNGIMGGDIGDADPFADIASPA